MAVTAAATREGCGSDRGPAGGPPPPPARHRPIVDSTFEAALVHRLDRLVDAHESAREAGIHDLHEAVLAFALEDVDGHARKVLRALLALHQLLEIGRVG